MLKTLMGLDDDDELSMKIILANNPRHNKIGRQLWAIFNFGEGFKGVMRFNPESNHGDHTRTLGGFEKACVLKQGVWPGPSPQGEQSWRFRWRGADFGTGVKDSTGDQATSRMIFKAGEDGKPILEAVFTYKFQMASFRGVKAAMPSVRYNGSEGSVTHEWLSYKSRQLY